MAKELSLEERLNRIMRELLEIKKSALPFKRAKTERSARAWNDLVELTDRITTAWRGPSVVDEIRDQREKTW